MGGAKNFNVEDGILNPKLPDFKTQLMMLQTLGRRRYRVLGEPWWPEELPSEEKYTRARQRLEGHDWAVDYIVTHCAPTDLAMTINRRSESDPLTGFLRGTRGKPGIVTGSLGTTIAIRQSTISASCSGNRSCRLYRITEKRSETVLCHISLFCVL